MLFENTISCIFTRNGLLRHYNHVISCPSFLKRKSKMFDNCCVLKFRRRSVVSYAKWQARGEGVLTHPREKKRFSLGVDTATRRLCTAAMRGYGMFDVQERKDRRKKEMVYPSRTSILFAVDIIWKEDEMSIRWQLGLTTTYTFSFHQFFFTENVAVFHETGMLFWTHFQLETKAWLDKNLKETANYKTAYQLIA